MLTFERRHEICRLVEQNGSVRIADLTARFGVSGETLRKDLLFLEKERHLKRIHGGAVSVAKSVYRKTLAERYDISREKKQELAEYAADFVENGDFIAIDAGATAAEFADVLARRFTSLHVVTYSAHIFQKLAYLPGFDVILCGGKFDPEEDCFYGDLTVRALRELHVQKAFIFPAAISLSRGLTNNVHDGLSVMNTLFEIADRHFLLADSDKIEKTAIYQLTELSPAHTIVCDSSLDDGIAALYAENGYTLICGKEGPHDKQTHR